MPLEVGAGIHILQNISTHEDFPLLFFSAEFYMNNYPREMVTTVYAII